MHELIHQVQVAPSILSADFSRLGEQVGSVMDAGARVIHVDVMDGHFVPNITVGPPVVATLAPLVHERGGVLDVHLMIEHPERYLQDFLRAGADGLTVHQEACVHLHRVLAEIRNGGAWAGVCINPATPVETLSDAREYCDLVLVMSVNPGFGGQSFIPGSVGKVMQARAYLPESVALEVDGGVGRGNARELVAAGANLLVAGSSIFAGDPGAGFAALRAAALA
jgi:ribulose-phosphate 3-epimerase